GDPQNKLVKKGFEPRIRDLKIMDSQGVDYTAEIFENPYYNLIIVAYDLAETNKSAVEDLNVLAINSAEHYNTRTVLLTAAADETLSAFKAKHKLVMEIFNADAVPLKSMVRSNPG